jgi:integrase
MARAGIELLKSYELQSLPVGFHSDGGCLYLRVSVTQGSKNGPRRSWIFRYEFKGRQRDMGLGSLDTFDLNEARAKARKARQHLSEGLDPIAARDASNAAKAAALAAAAPKPSFDTIAADYLKGHSMKWSRGHAMQWETTLRTVASPAIGSKPIDTITRADVIAMLKPVWYKTPTHASRLRQRVEAILDYAKAHDFRSGDNPAAWRGNLQTVFSKKSEVRKIKHHPALPYAEIGAFMQRLRERESFARLAFEFCILTATRQAETLGAEWREIDLDKKTWTIRADRMKSKREHRVPLSPPAIKILHKARTLAQKLGFAKATHIFLNEISGYRLGPRALAEKLRVGLRRRDITAHGFRSSFADWAGETTSYPKHVIEQALAHTTGNAVELAYRRGDLFEKRRLLMADWAKYCAEPLPQGVVVPFAVAGEA